MKLYLNMYKQNIFMCKMNIKILKKNLEIAESCIDIYFFILIKISYLISLLYIKEFNFKNCV